MKLSPLKIPPAMFALFLACDLLLLTALLIPLTGCGAGSQTPASPEAVAEPSADDEATDEETAGDREPADPLTGYMTFVINVHDTEHVDESADTILRLIGIYEKYGVRGDFYLTAPMTKLYADKRPEVITRLRDSNMAISYHVRPPDPLYSGFDQRLKGLSDAALAETLRAYATQELDLTTGDYIAGEPGGYAYVADIFGRKPVTVSIPNRDHRIKNAAEELYAGLGARMTVYYHEEGTDPASPYQWTNNLLIRPSDFSITRWGDSGKQGAAKDPFWWNMLTTPRAADYNPVQHLQQEQADWLAKNTGRLPFVTSLIHENNFYRSGAEGWTLSYFSGNDKQQPLQPPYDLNAPDPSSKRSPEEQQAIWKAYEEMVAYTAARMKVVTSGDIVALAAGGS